jgi:hypothetical protein
LFNGRDVYDEVSENDVMRIELTLDCADLDTSATFWQGALGVRYRRCD